jgi:hypothetical protein
MTMLYQATNVRAPQYRTTDIDGSGPLPYSSQILYTVAAASKVNELPERFHGKYVRVLSDVNVDLLFSDNPAQVVDNTIAATDAGAVSTNLGGKVPTALGPREFRVPTPPPNGKIYFARQGSGTGYVLIELASD